MLDNEGREIPDNTPLVVRFRGRTISQFDQVRAYIRNELSRQAEALEMESFEDANDFQVDDDLFPVSPHEYSEDTEAADREALLAGDPSRPRQAEVAPQVESSSSPPVQGGEAAPSSSEPQ